MRLRKTGIIVHRVNNAFSADCEGQMLELLPDLISRSASRAEDTPAIRHKDLTLSYGELLDAVRRFSNGLYSAGIERGDRVAVFAGKCPEYVVAMFGCNEAGGAFVPINGLLKPQQVAYILKDCNVRVLVTTAARLGRLTEVLPDCPDLRCIVVIDSEDAAAGAPGLDQSGWKPFLDAAEPARRHRVIASDMSAIMYTSGSTGLPKGVVLSHTNMLLGASSVASYIGNTPEDRILAALPLSFDAGLSQLTTGLYAGACVILHEYLLARDVVRIVEREQITGLTAVPPMWIQLTEQSWPEGAPDSLRYFANTGGKMPRETLNRLRAIFKKADPFLMYGLTESFRSTYLPPGEVDRRPDSIGKAIPNVEVMVARPDGSLCDTGEVGELVHRGPLVSLGYWNDPERTAVRFKPAPGQLPELPNPELAVWSGDSVKADEEGYLYFVGRMDDMIKTSGYRVSPAEVEEIAYDTGLVSEVAALGISHAKLGQAIVLVAKSRSSDSEPTDALLLEIRSRAPNYMIPAAVHWKDSLPRNANGKIDRPTLVNEFANLFDEARQQ